MNEYAPMSQDLNHRPMEMFDGNLWLAPHYKRGVKLKVNSSAITPGMEHLPRLARAMPVDLTWAAMRAFLSSLNLCLYRHPILPSPDLPHLVIFKSE